MSLLRPRGSRYIAGSGPPECAIIVVTPKARPAVTAAPDFSRAVLDRRQQDLVLSDLGVQSGLEPRCRSSVGHPRHGDLTMGGFEEHDEVAALKLVVSLPSPWPEVASSIWKHVDHCTKNKAQ